MLHPTPINIFTSMFCSGNAWACVLLPANIQYCLTFSHCGIRISGQQLQPHPCLYVRIIQTLVGQCAKK